MGLRVWSVPPFLFKFNSKLAISVSQLETVLERMTLTGTEVPVWDRGKCRGIKEKRDTAFLITQPVRMLHSHSFTVI